MRAYCWLALLLAVVVAACSGEVEPAAPEPAAPEPPVAVTSPSPAPVSSRTPAPPPSPAPSSPAALLPSPPAVPTPTTLGVFDVDLAPEVSGMVASRRDPGLLWLVDDGPGTTSIVAVRHDGTLVTRVEMEGVDGSDVEDLAAGPCGREDPTPCLYVGDIGDNVADRDHILVHRFPEPAADVTTTPVTTATYTFPGGPVDAEGLLVTPAGLPIVLTKEAGRTRVMAAAAFADGALVHTGTMTIPVPSRPLLTTVAGLSVTAADSTPDGLAVLLRTYDTVLELTAPRPDAPLEELATWPATELPVALEGQGESVAFLADGHSYVTAGEGSGAIAVVRR